MALDLIKKTYLESEIVMKGDYPYFVNAISDGNPEITKELMTELVHAVRSNSDLDCDLILAPEAMGIPLGTAITMLTGIPFRIIRKRDSQLPGTFEVEYKTGYSTAKMYVAAMKPGTRVIVVDDVFSTGGTIKALVNALREHDIIVKEIIVILNKCPDIDAASKELDVPITHILDVTVVDGKPALRIP